VGSVQCQLGRARAVEHRAQPRECGEEWGVGELLVAATCHHTAMQPLPRGHERRTERLVVRIQHFSIGVKGVARDCLGGSTVKLASFEHN
jgi:hypothetical protein